MSQRKDPKPRRRLSTPCAASPNQTSGRSLTSCSRLPENPHILDVGGGPGTYAEAFTEGGAQVTVFDLPEVVDLERFANRMVLCKDVGHGHLLEGPKDQGLGRAGPGHAEEGG